VVEWKLEGMRRDEQSITRDWQLVNQRVIDGVRVKEVAAVMTGYGVLTEVYRKDWHLDDGPIDQIFQSHVEPGGISGWHAHAETTDRLFVAKGRMRIVLYDSRRKSATYGLINEFRLGEGRSGLVVIPPKVWHAVENIGGIASVLINSVDQAYRYEAPDHYRLPLDTDQIPFRFSQHRGGAVDGTPRRDAAAPRS
jgi:dTDP-4-dehydrorhamnose 3,5-epimerase